MKKNIRYFTIARSAQSSLGTRITGIRPIHEAATIRAMLENDLEQEHGAIELYNQIIQVSESSRDQATLKRFRMILKDEEGIIRSSLTL